MAYWSGLPSLIFGVTSLVSGALALFVPETAHAALPDTVQEAEDLGRRGARRRGSRSTRLTDIPHPTEPSD